MNLNATVVFLGISYIQHSGAWVLVLLIPFMSALVALVTLHMMHYNLIYQPEKCCSLLNNFWGACQCPENMPPETLPSWQRCGKLVRPHQGKKWWLLHGDPCGRQNFFPFFPLFIFQLLYRMCMMQISSGCYLQTMNSNLNLDGSLLPISFMNAISVLPLLILTTFMEYFSTCLFPSKRDGPFLSTCIIAGNLSAALSMMVAVFFEIHRKHFPPVEQPLSGKILTVSSMPCFHLVLQYILLGVAETVVNPAFSVISYRFVPSTIRETSMSFLTLFNGFGCFTGALLVELVYLTSEGLSMRLYSTMLQSWHRQASEKENIGVQLVPNTLNKGNLESFFFLASLTLLNVLGFWSVSQRYCNLNHFNAQNISGSNLEETLPLHEKSLRFYGGIQEFSSSIDLWETAL